MKVGKVRRVAKEKVRRVAEEKVVELMGWQGLTFFSQYFLN